MKLKARPQDFKVVERLVRAPDGQGAWGLYRVTKRDLSTLEVQRQLAQVLNAPTRQVVFPALKDKAAVAVQYATLPAHAPDRLIGHGYEADRVGYWPRPLAPSDLAGNRFTLTVRDLSNDEAARLQAGLVAVSTQGLPNYFDEQRFGSYAPGWGYVGKAILQRDAERAIYGYMAVPFAGDVRSVAAFKRRAAALWPNWRAIMEIAPRPSNWRSVLTYLIDHPDGYRKALNLIPARLLALYLAAYQSALWNSMLSAALQADTGQASSGQIQVADQRLAVPRAAATWSAAEVPLPSAQARYEAPFKDAAASVLAAEGLSLADLKARILERAYLARSTRPVWCRPVDLAVSGPLPDELFAGRQKLDVSFGLGRGSYATLIVKVAAVRGG